ncbi:hypothetical protein ACE1ET_09335 [Saccharicrinis sp. FJH62]|uniref:hypothetical protein n=1 Tax=Saccharicrinis sp. FJH62 TaxID=3344657 RepID=UPI0035D40009
MMEDRLSPDAKIFLMMENEVLRFQIFQNNVLNQEVVLKAGYEFISGKFFRHDIPTYDETDYAINHIEDQLMTHKSRIQSSRELCTSDEELKNVFRKNDLNENSYSRESIEKLFSSYARVIMGAPISELKAGVTQKDYAIVLVLREIMHHLDFEYLNFSN